MEAILLTISRFAPSMFYTFMAFLILSKAFVHIVMVLANRYNLQAIQLAKELEQLRQEHDAFVAKLTNVEPGPTTNGSCPVTCGECQIDEFEAKFAKHQTAHRKLTMSNQLLIDLWLSPLGQLLSFIGNSDTLNVRRRS